MTEHSVEPVRALTLERHFTGATFKSHEEGGGPLDIPVHTPTRVLPADPILNLLERVEKKISPRSMLHVEVWAILRANGRTP